MTAPPSNQTLQDAFNSAVTELNVNKNYKKYRAYLHDDVVIFHIHTDDAMYGISDVDKFFGPRFGTITFSPGQTSFDERSGIVKGKGGTWFDAASNRTDTVDYQFIFTYVANSWLITNLRAWIPPPS
jgi:hypothetical protein